MDSSMVEENGSSAIGDPLGGAGGGGGGTGPSAGGEATGGSAGRGPATGATQLNENSGTSSNGNGSGGAAVAAPTAGAAAGGGGGGGGGSGGTGSAVTALGALTGAAGTAHSEAVLVSAATAGAGPNIVQLIPASQTAGQAQSVIQQNQQSVIQTAAGNVPITRGVLLVCNKPNSVIHTTTGNLQTIHIKPEPHIGTGSSGIMTDTNSDDTLSDEEASPKKRRDLLTRRPSYRKILSDLGGAEIANNPSDGPGLHTITTPGGGVVQYSQPQEGIYVPHIFPNTVMGGNVQLEDQSRKREMRLQKNREAARECRRKKKEYIKCLENRVAVLENQNKALIEELKSLKELYCQQKSD
ncbi:cyclic AMP response element-binding protein B isoform X1 [Anopheles ziemanni]|uniref:cyclic AMP response element-binding protein B isoform X1 n=1 Tax=Anopheles coustani TaxID=139045 RepID=UPI002657E473|nr:cyclic AMP response element-binding protein B isoform X1 [Anopheles coustani]XP_058176553.1 cyclic AMP response element-binding protein B isoform X1 [Anopheles ziemanni]